MPDSPFGPLRLYDASRAELARPALFQQDEGEAMFSSLEALAVRLARQEHLRPTHQDPEHVEPLSLQWYLAVEQVRHHRQGRWIPALLEFGKHQGEKLLGLGPGLGSDLVQYARCGAEVFAASSSLEQLALIRRNFELRGLKATFLHASAHALPLEASSIDVVCLTGILHEPRDPAPVIEEAYRVLKPGGKFLAIVPARYDIEYWSRLFFLRQHGRHDPDPIPPSPPSLLCASARHFSSRELRQLLHRFHEVRICKRHLRRAEVPHLWRWLPLSLLERLAGRLLVFKGFKPVSAARVDQLAA